MFGFAQKIMKKIILLFCGFVRVIRLFPSYIIAKKPAKRDVVYVIENANWSIKWDGINIIDCLKLNGRNGWVDTSVTFYKNKIIHLGSSYVFEQFCSQLKPGHNHYVVNFFHGRYGRDSPFNRRYELLREHIDSITGVIYSTSIMKKRFLEFGLPENKLFYVPIGVDLKQFQPISRSKILNKRRALGIPKDALLIGSFQKDGEGWGEGMTPKIIKAPDVFVEVIKRLNKQHTIFCLLTGPARGYVKKALEEAGIPFLHKYFDNYLDIVPFYQILDFYIITSREEGGPKALLESLACGVPVVTTDVGMARDVIGEGNCGIICDVDDIDALVKSTTNIIHNKKMRQDMIQNGLSRIQNYSWLSTSRSCEGVYKTVEQK